MRVLALSLDPRYHRHDVTPFCCSQVSHPRLLVCPSSRAMPMTFVGFVVGLVLTLHAAKLVHARPEPVDAHAIAASSAQCFAGGLSQNVISASTRPSGAPGLQKGTRGLAVCNSTSLQLLFVCFDNWHAGHARTQFCENPPANVLSASACAPDAGWWVSCGDIVSADSQQVSTPYSQHAPSTSELNTLTAPQGATPTMRHWALLVAGSRTWANYRHQADVYHAYQILKRNGIPDENIVVMHYDDVAYAVENPHPGRVINSPDGPDVYAGVPKDYVGEDVTADNFLAVLRGDKEAMVGIGSGKVIDSASVDKVFVYYADHGAPGVLGMPVGPFLYGIDLVDALKYKAQHRKFKEMVLYVEACESGSIFEGLLPDDLNIFATTAATGQESSWGCYCPGMSPPPPPEYHTCLGDKYSVSWMEDADKLNRSSTETLGQQFDLVKAETSSHSFQGGFQPGSHVLEFGTLRISAERVESWIGLQNDMLKPASSPHFDSRDDFNVSTNSEERRIHRTTTECGQRVATEQYYVESVHAAVEGSLARARAAKKLADFQTEHARTDDMVMRTLQSLAKIVTNATRTLDSNETVERWVETVRPRGIAVVDDWECMKERVASWEANCGPLGEFGMHWTRTFANTCNDGVSPNDFRLAANETCKFGHDAYSSVQLNNNRSQQSLTKMR